MIDIEPQWQKHILTLYDDKNDTKGIFIHD